MDELLMCSVCIERYSELNRHPVLLPRCGHSFCRPCVAMLVSGGGIVCPACRTDQRIEHAEKLPTEYTLLAIINAQENTKKETCEIHKVKLSFWCSTCKTPTCGECLFEDHPTNSHTVIRASKYIQDIKQTAQDVAVKFIEVLDEREQRYYKTIFSCARRISGAIRNVKLLKKDMEEARDLMKGIKEEASVSSVTSLSEAAKFLASKWNIQDANLKEKEQKANENHPINNDSPKCRTNGLLQGVSNNKEVDTAVIDEKQSLSEISIPKICNSEAAILANGETNLNTTTSITPKENEIKISDLKNSILTVTTEEVLKINMESEKLKQSDDVISNNNEIDKAENKLEHIKSNDIVNGTSKSVEEAKNVDQINVPSRSKSQKQKASKKAQIDAQDVMPQINPLPTPQKPVILNNINSNNNKDNTDHKISNSKQEPDNDCFNENKKSSHSIKQDNKDPINAESGLSAFSNITQNVLEKSATEEKLMDFLQVPGFMLCVEADDGRLGVIDWGPQGLHVHCLQFMDVTYDIVIRESFLNAMIPSKTPTVFLELSTEQAVLGRVYIKLWGHLRRSHNFLSLCLGSQGKSYMNTKFLQVYNVNGAGERILGGDYENNNGRGGKELLNDLEWNGDYAMEMKAGMITAAGTGQPTTNSLFLICTQSDASRSFSCPFGLVFEGLKVVKEAVKCQATTSVHVSDCGVLIIPPRYELNKST